MPSCPRCHQSVFINAVTCSNCGLELKAHGHPGIDLHRSEGGTYLCDTCVYHQDDSCTFPQRPQATTCTLYVDTAQKPVPEASKIYTIPWWRKYSGWLMLAALILISVVLVVI
ncbi:zinc ribbon domain-containing protein [Leptolyngbyaceae cyanobacterium CCMR0082]|uniref:Zinc ribbon domain-containing protein n=2 Tax=Adonisia turfae TaxID=2950184 RepID=A0A6M0RZC3_9CYAN|nr:zinc ribbon domain-containing protein [Adonisia turfae]MDV3349725.1 zinc ribbon domain-containing protein [Leptothoe sp. LEGE 181152]NEZ57489.1 zinc ribbon domain-containing protein [Adonisia turfae CCMR0081]NEZ61243.1 zinc ribbon domain-containing protein [Adonisia turfae CCMR0082]